MPVSIDKDKLPTHVAIIMDGNGRWARQRGEQRVFGHHSGVQSVRDITEAAAELGIKYLTLYAFSTENWHRPKEEVDALMHLLVATINNEIKTLNDNQIRLKAIGDIQSLDAKVREELNEAINKTAHNQRMDLYLALSYSGRWEIVNAIRQIVAEISSGQVDASAIDETLLCQHLCDPALPDPELMIRTSGEFRTSNFLMWQSAYTELYFTPVLWPDFRKEDFYQAIHDYQHRERRFGKTSDQLSNSAG